MLSKNVKTLPLLRLPSFELKFRMKIPRSVDLKGVHNARKTFQSDLWPGVILCPPHDSTAHLLIPH